MVNKIATINSEFFHYGSTAEGPVLSSIQNNPPSFVSINGSTIVSTEDLIDTPSHIFTLGPPPLSHSHSNQEVDNLNNTFVFIENNNVLVVGDSNIAEDTRITDEIQNFVFIH